MSTEEGHRAIFKIQVLFDVSLSTTFYDIIAKWSVRMKGCKSACALLWEIFEQ